MKHMMGVGVHKHVFSTGAALWWWRCVVRSFGRHFKAFQRPTYIQCLVITSSLSIKEMQNWYNFHQPRKQHDDKHIFQLFLDRKQQQTTSGLVLKLWESNIWRLMATVVKETSGSRSHFKHTFLDLISWSTRRMLVYFRYLLGKKTE